MTIGQPSLATMTHLPPHPLGVTSFVRQRAAYTRDLTRLRRLEERYRLRAVVTRGARGAVGFLAGLIGAIKVKIAATISGKLVVAALIATGFIWPGMVLWLVVVSLIGLVAVLVCTLLGLDTEWFGSAVYGLPCDECWDCRRKNKRRQRILDMIAERESWLRDHQGPNP